MAQGSRSALRVMKPCPICGTLLEPGQRVHTVVFSGDPPGRAAPREGERTRDALVHMFGCPYCHPSNDRYPRICPVCDTTLAEDGYLIARMFTRDTRKHVHVLGCTSCRSAAVERRQRHSG